MLMNVIVESRLVNMEKTKPDVRWRVPEIRMKFVETFGTTRFTKKVLRLLIIIDINV